MKDLLKENNQQKHQFRSYYCLSCNQVKPCGILTSESCCSCYFQNEKEKAQEYSDYQKVYQQEIKEKEESFKQLRKLKDYKGCLKCGSKEVDAYDLYEENKLVCQPCLVRKEGGSSSPISFSEQSKWYKRHWEIDLEEWIEKFFRLPVNKNCADKWLKNKEHLKDCDCLIEYAKYLVELHSGSLKEYEEKLKECKCEKSEKVRVRSDYFTKCERCGKSVKVASKKRVIRNRNDVRFWGVESSYKILCLGCVGRYYKEMEGWQKKKWREYRRRGYG